MLKYQPESKKKPALKKKMPQKATKVIAWPKVKSRAFPNKKLEWEFRFADPTVDESAAVKQREVKRIPMPTSPAKIPSKKVRK